MSRRLIICFCFFVEGLKIPGMLTAFNTCMGSSLALSEVESLEAAWKEISVSRDVVDWAEVASVGAHQLFAGIMADAMWTANDTNNSAMRPPAPEGSPDMMGTTAVVDMEHEIEQEIPVIQKDSTSADSMTEIGSTKGGTDGTQMTSAQTPPSGMTSSAASAVPEDGTGVVDKTDVDASDDDMDSDDEKTLLKLYGTRDGVVESYNVETTKITFRMNNGGLVMLTPQNVAKAALKAFESKSKLVDVGENWTKVLSGNIDGVEFIKEISHADAKFILTSHMAREQKKRVVVDKAYTSMFFARIDGPNCIEPVTGPMIPLTHPYLSRGMERYLNIVNDTFFLPRGNARLTSDMVQLGVGTVPGGTEGFGVFVRKDFTMPVSSDSEAAMVSHKDMQDDFLLTMPLVGYPLCTTKMKANGLTIEGVLAVSSSQENGGLRSQLVDKDYPNVIFVSHGGCLATLVNAGGQYSKMEIVPQIEVDALDENKKEVKLKDAFWDADLAKFFKKHPKIANCLVSSMMIPRVMGRLKSKSKVPSVTVDGVSCIGTSIPSFYMCPKDGETFRKGEEIFCDYRVGNEQFVDLDEEDYRFLGNSTSTKYVAPIAFQDILLERVRIATEKAKAAENAKASLNLDEIPEATLAKANEINFETDKPLTVGIMPEFEGKKVAKRKRSKKAAKGASSGFKPPKRGKKEAEKKSSSAFPSAKLSSAEIAKAVARRTSMLEELGKAMETSSK